MALEINPTTGKLDLVLSQDEIDHTNLLNIGVNSHTQIDSHISNLSNPHGVTYTQVGAIQDAVDIVNDTHIDWGVGVNQVSADDVPDGSANAIVSLIQETNWDNHLSDFSDPHNTTWAQVDKTVSNISDITTKSHTSLTDIGTNTHTVIDSHIADGTLHFLEGSIDHGNILGLSDDDHTQYALLAGRSGGQTLVGGLASGEDLILNPTTHTTKGNVAVIGTSPLEFRPGSDVDMVVLKVADQAETTQISLGTNPINTLNRWEFVGLGGLFVGATIESDFTAPNDDATSIGMQGTTKVTYKSSGTYNIYGKLTSIEPNFGSSSVVNSGIARGHRIELLDVVGASFIEGTQDKVILADLYLSISDLPSSAGTINTSIGVNLDINKNWSSVEPTLTNGYGFKIVDIQATNAWGLYLEPTNLNNWIAGTLGIGVANSTPTSTFSVEGSVEFTALSVSTNTTLTSSHCIVFVDASGGAVTITLPTPVVFAPSRFYYIYKVDASANAVSVIAGGTDTLVGITSTGTQYNMLKLVGLTTTSWVSSEI